VTSWPSFFFGLFFGFLSALFFTVMVFRWGWRNLELLRQVIREVYHIDLLPFIDRIQGLINLALMELLSNTSFVKMYLEMAYEEIIKLKEQVTSAVKRHEHL
jgi:hypothetical protein